MPGFPQIAGIAGALFGFITTLGGAVTSSLLAMSQDKNQNPLAWSIIMCALLSMIIYHFITKEES